MWMPLLMEQGDQEVLALSLETPRVVSLLHHIVSYRIQWMRLQTEACALRDGLLLAQQIGCCRVEIQSDCMEVVNTMQDAGFSATVAAAIYDECAQYWKEFVAISISHCNRTCNSATHELARQVLLEKSSHVWVDDPPSSILQLLVNDVSILLNQ